MALFKRNTNPNTSQGQQGPQKKIFAISILCIMALLGILGFMKHLEKGYLDKSYVYSNPQSEFSIRIPFPFTLKASGTPEETTFRRRSTGESISIKRTFASKDKPSLDQIVPYITKNSEGNELPSLTYNEVKVKEFRSIVVHSPGDESFFILKDKYIWKVSFRYSDTKSELLANSTVIAKSLEEKERQ